MTKVVLDASALVAYLRREPGAGRVGEVIGRAAVSAVTLAEVLSHPLVRAGLDRAAAALHVLPLEVIEFRREDAVAAATLGAGGSPARLTLGDRCCLAVALRLGAPVLTADRHWSGLDVGVTVELIR